MDMGMGHIQVWIDSGGDGDGQVKREEGVERGERKVVGVDRHDG